MKHLTLLLPILFFSFNLFSQQNEIEYTEISPDGKLISTYKKNPSTLVGTVEKSLDDIPFGLTPDWTSVLERQIGGMAWADYDDDGDLDLATGCYFSQSFPPIPDFEVLIYNNDNGNLSTSPVWISSDMRSTTDIRFADLDDDGRPELLAANGNESFVSSVIYFNGSGGLNNTPGWISQDNNWTVGSAFSDIDGDGDLDLAFGNQGNSVIPTKPLCIFYNNGSGFLTFPDWYSADEMLSNSVAFGDINNSDLVTKTVNYIGDGNSYTFPLKLFPIYSIDSVLINEQPFYHYCYDVISGWISLGTKPSAGSSLRIVYRYISRGDLAVSKWVNYESGIYFNNSGVISILPGWTVGNTQSQKGIAWADFDRDGFMDLAISGSSTQTVIYKNDNGTLTGPVWTSNTTNPSAQELITGDLDGDGYPELAVVHFGSRKVEIFKNRNGLLDTDATWLYNAPSSATSISFGDLNGDGALDLAVGTARAPVVVFINQSPPIPVELVSFKASHINGLVNLEWSTASELNNIGFEIERKSNNENYMMIGFVEGQGTTTESNYYSFIDRVTKISSRIAYRLKQIDYNGNYKYSNEVFVEIPGLSDFTLYQNYPNPFNPNTKIKYSVPQPSDVNIKVVNILGNEIATLVNKEKPAGSYEVEFDASGIPSGVYFYQLKAGSFVETKKMVLMK